MGVKIQGNKIYLPKIGGMRFYNSRSIPDGFTIKACAVRKRQNGWYVSIRIENKSVPDYIAKDLEDVVKVIGCGLGIAKLVDLSDGYQIENPKFSINKKVKRTLFKQTSIAIPQGIVESASEKTLLMYSPCTRSHCYESGDGFAP
jgi:putative transposase